MPRNRSDQPSLPESDDVKNPRVHSAAVRYRERMLERKAAGEEEKEAHDNLVRIMHEEGIDSYRYGDIEVHIDKTEKAKVKKTTQAESEE